MQDPKFQVLDQFIYHHALEETRGIAITIFTTQSCSSCKAWKSLLASYQNFHPAIKIFEIDAEKEPALVNELDIFHLPAVFLYVNGQFHCQLQSEARLSEFEKAVQKALQSPAEEQP